MEYTIEGPLFGKSTECTPILQSLPEWFGLQSGLDHYSSVIDQLPTFLASSPPGVIGFLSLKQHNPFSAEIYVMGILPGMHRLGIGKALVNAAQSWLKLQATEFLQVKTLGPSNPDPNYARTRDFYQALGFRPLEEFSQIWDEHNPCLILVKRL
jgi:GNAT superfamily N-acetyltransferase